MCASARVKRITMNTQKDIVCTYTILASERINDIVKKIVENKELLNKQDKGEVIINFSNTHTTVTIKVYV